MKHIILIAIVFIFGCEDWSIESRINNMTKPVYIAAVGGEGNVVLRSANGKILAMDQSFYIAKAIKSSGFKNGDIFIPLKKETNSYE